MTTKTDPFQQAITIEGLTLSDEQKGELHAAYGYIEAMSKRVRVGGERPRSAEPAIILNPRVT